MITIGPSPIMNHTVKCFHTRPAWKRRPHSYSFSYLYNNIKCLNPLWNFLTFCQLTSIRPMTGNDTVSARNRICSRHACSSLPTLTQLVSSVLFWRSVFSFTLCFEGCCKCCYCTLYRIFDSRFQLPIINTQETVVENHPNKRNQSKVPS